VQSGLQNESNDGGVEDENENGGAWGPEAEFEGFSDDGFGETVEDMEDDEEVKGKGKSVEYVRRGKSDMEGEECDENEYRDVDGMERVRNDGDEGVSNDDTISEPEYCDADDEVTTDEEPQQDEQCMIIKSQA